MTKAAIACGLALAVAASTPALAGHGWNGGNGNNFGAYVGAGILGGILGATIAPQPQPYIVVVPQPTYAPGFAPTYAPGFAPTYAPGYTMPPMPGYAPVPDLPYYWFCPSRGLYYPNVQNCAGPWQHR